MSNDLVSIKISRKTKELLDAQKAHSSMSYDAVISAFAKGAKIDWNEAPQEEQLLNEVESLNELDKEEEE